MEPWWDHLGLCPATDWKLQGQALCHIPWEAVPVIGYSHCKNLLLLSRRNLAWSNLSMLLLVVRGSALSVATHWVLEFHKQPSLLQEEKVWLFQSFLAIFLIIFSTFIRFIIKIRLYLILCCSCWHLCQSPTTAAVCPAHFIQIYPDPRKLPLIHFHNFPPCVDLFLALQGHFTMKFSLQTSPDPHTEWDWCEIKNTLGRVCSACALCSPIFLHGMLNLC